jgi:putative nucleotidyltransferase with HDIG domain
MKRFLHLFLVPALVVLTADLFVPVSPKSLLLEYFIITVIWYLSLKDLVRTERIMSLHPNYLMVLYVTLVIGGAITSFVVDKWDGAVSTVYFFCSIAVLLLGDRPGKSVGLVLSFLIFLHFQRDVWLLSGGIVATIITSMTLKSVYRRSDVVKSAVFMSLANIGVSILKLLVDGYIGKYEIYINAVNPFVSSVFLLGVLPYVEYTSRIYSNIGLMELGNLNHPLLKELSIKAPGTYQHSTMVANLAEAAAERIGVNSLLARVASYYHDIGKMKRSKFFVENQFDGVNPHDDISPYLSHLILDEHVRYGQELARKYRLPIPVECIIVEHHGTRIQKYFYYKAKELDPNVREDDFRYPGPKPRFKESGIIMLADSVEATSRTLKSKTHSQIKSTVEEIVMGIFHERQLDSSGLTLEDLESIIDEFTKVISTFYHSRVEYPKEGKAGEV